MHFPIAVITHETDGTKIPDEIESLLMRYSEVGDPFWWGAGYEFVEDEHGDEVHPETGERGWWINEDMHYDWYEQGGGFEGWLRLASDTETHSQHETSTMVSLVDSSRWSADFEAVVTPDGEWHPDDIEGENFPEIASRHRDCAVTVVDCHI